MKGIKKSFGENQVLRGVDFNIIAGEIHALMGENGAGKSTLMNILTGLLQADEGSIWVDNQEVKYDNPNDAEGNGISFIHQEMNVWPDMTVLENLFMGKEITKSLLSKSEVIIMDEPSAALTEREIRTLFSIIDKLTARGVAIIYISHRMEEVFEMSNRITVLRDGVSVGTLQTKETNNDEIVRMMVGRDLEDYYPSKTNEIGEIAFEVQNLSKDKVFKDISFQVRSGEIVGFSGLMGAGRTEIMRSIFGMDSLDSGKLILEGEEIVIHNPSSAIAHGIGFLTENRKDEGLILDESIRENISLPSIDGFNKGMVIDEKAEREFAELLAKRLAVRAMNVEDEVSSLSGGNQQKVVFAKWIGMGSKVLILDEPTRGVDVGAKREIYQLMNELAERGVAIIMVSSDLPEILGVSDRIIVIHEGKVAGELTKQEATEEKIMMYATGGK